MSNVALAFDYGSKRIGIAVGEATLGTAQPLSHVGNTNGTPDWSAIDALVSEWQPQQLVVGWPLTLDGEMQAITYHVKGFMKRLGKRYDKPVHKADERYSSMAAQEQIRTLRARGQWSKRATHGDVDALAAALILEGWFAQPDNMKP